MLVAGKILRNRYEIVKLLGSGGFGDTYLAKDRDLPGHPLCVVKHLQPKDPNPAVLLVARRLFETEAEVLYKLGNSCERIPRLFAHFEETGEFYLVQDYIEGHDLTEELTENKQLSEPEAIKLLQEILGILADVHHKNIIHRDINPKNIMRRKKDDQLMLIDFGAVKEIGVLMVNAQGHTNVSVAIGSLGYMPIEQAMGRPKPSSDIYAVGMIGIQALTGITPNQLPEDNDGEVIWKNRVSVSDGLADVLDKMVRSHFTQRYQDATEALQALNSVAAAPSSPTPLNSVAAAPSSPTPLNSVAAAPSSPTPLNSVAAAPSSPTPLNSVAAAPSSSTPTTPSPTNKITRRTLLHLTAFAGVVGVGLVISKNFWNQQPETVGDNPHPPEPETPTFGFTTVTVNARGETVSRQHRQAGVFVENLSNNVILETVAIPGGKFLMGSPATEQERESSESPQHSVMLQPFFLGKYPVTQVQWQAVMGNNPAHFRGNNRPVENVSWNDAIAFCQKLSKKTGRNYRLPSEAEWEYACRAGTTTPFYFGKTITSDLANYNSDYIYASAPKGVNRRETTDAGSFPPNAFGLYDMHGNVWEWCQDVWHENYNGAPSDGSAWESGGDIIHFYGSEEGASSPLSKKHGYGRMQRGGSWYFNPRNCRSANRSRNVPDYWSYYIGFRVVLVPA
ncbi:bifunctional serine/threonine-protein kinase/formylglycine-generating enzyme family protein [Microcoleus sp. FACHB-68]|uniref:SUMF1/EgtB/PvdO family nonheme iron enzyme n=1 Tax=Microcoleus sp. FACHB-68 TaxID=2692826 RepID=UPI001687567C|nr:SUMF1/EgtB/PvdO family nonheme iron enzyme [Microcoleus sp. FACHB-68]